MTLKVLEGAVGELLGALREEITASARGKLGGFLIRPAARRLRDRLDPDTYGGAYLLGLRGLAVIAHGNSGRRAIANAIRLAARGAEHDLVDVLPTAFRNEPRAPRAERRLLPEGCRRCPVYYRRASEPPPTNEVTWQRRVKRSSSV